MKWGRPRGRQLADSPSAPIIALLINFEVMGLLLQGGPAPKFIPGSAVSQAGAKVQNIGYAGGAITAPVGTLDYFFALNKGNADFCNSPAVTVVRTGHSRVRVIGGGATSVKGVSFSLAKYPFVEDQSGQAGIEMAIVDPSTGESWVLRRRGSMQAMIAAICSGGLQAERTFYLRSARGRTYGPFLAPGTTTP